VQKINKYKRSSIILLLIIICIITGCEYSEEQNNYISLEENYTEEIYYGFSENYEGPIMHLEGFEGQNYYDMGLWNNFNSIHNTTMSIDNSDTFSCYMSISNFLGNQYNFTIILLDNYEQKSILVDNIEMEKCTVSIEANSSINIPIIVPALKEGKHDLIFVVFINTYSEMSEEERMFAGSNDGYLRCNVIVNNTLEYPEAISASIIETSTARTDGIRLNRLNDDYYSIESGNLGTETENCAIILFDNFEQIKLSDNSKYIYVELYPNEGVVIPINDYIDTNDGLSHEISAISIRDVGSEADNFEGLVYFSNRISQP